MKTSTNFTTLSRLALLAGTILSAPGLAWAQSVTEEGYTDEIVVRGENIPDPQRNTSEVVSVLTSDDLVRQGDDTAALALTRLSGLSLVGGRWAYVRGLGDRYSVALLNGSPLPSTDPLRRQVPLDLFPSNMLDGATVQKTFSPNYPGEFGGGVIDLTTKRLPDENFVTIKVGGGINFVSTAKTGIVHRGSKADWTGLGGGVRETPVELQTELASGRRITRENNRYTLAELETIGDGLVSPAHNSPLTVVQDGQLPPDFKAEISAGGTIDFDKFDLGLIGIVGYDSKQRLRKAIRQFASAGQQTADLTAETTYWDITFNAFGSASLDWDGNSVTLTALLVRSSDKKTQFVDGDVVGESDLVGHTEKTAWYERKLATAQLSGEHDLGQLNIKWRTSVAETTRNAPYERFVGYSHSKMNAQDPFEFDLQNGGNGINFSYLNDQIFSGGLDASYTVPLSPYRDAVFSAGFAYSKTDRDYSLRKFFFDELIAAPDSVKQSRPDYLFQPDNIGSVYFLDESRDDRDNSYDGLLDNKAAYVSADVEIIPLVHVAAGVRYEEAREMVRTLPIFIDELPFSATFDRRNDYWLPGATVTWNFAEDMLIRAGYSQTIARPQFRELAYAEYTDPETERSYRGNPFLKDSKFHNYDVRWEYYFGRNQYATLAGFYKKISNPIEEIVLPGAETGVDTRFINSPRAKLFGGEAEYRTRFEMPFDVPVLENPDWLFSVNYTYTHSEVNGTTELVATSLGADPSMPLYLPASNFDVDGKTLQGTPKHIVNVQFGWEAERSQTTLLLGWVSERILQRGLGTVPDIKERPGVNLDFVHKQDLDIHGVPFTLGLTARNLLGTKHKEFQDYTDLNNIGQRSDVDTYALGRTVSASLSTTF